MQKFLRISGSISFLLFIFVNYFLYHPSYLNFGQIFGGGRAFACPGAGVLVCNTSLVWPIVGVVGLIIAAVSLTFWVSKNKTEITWSPRPVALLGYTNVFFLLIASVYYFNSSFSGSMSHPTVLVTWSAAMWSLLGYWVPILLMLLLVTMIASLLGARLMQLLNLTFVKRPTRLVVSIALGLSFFILFFSVLGQLGLFTFWPIIIFALIAVLFSYSVLGSVCSDLFWRPVSLKFSYDSLSWFLLTILFLVIGMNVFDLLRPVPIGWDDLGVYMNFPRQIAMKGVLLSGFSGQAYMLISALGFILGNSTMLSLFFSWYGGVLAIVALYAFGRQFISARAGLLMATIMYVLPMTMHQSFADMKMDMPLFFFIVSAFLCLFMALKQATIGKRFWSLILLTGVLLGTAMAIKITTAIALFPLFILLAWRYSGGFSAMAVGGVLHALYFYQFVSASDISLSSRWYIAAGSMLLAVVGFIFALKKRESIVTYLRIGLVMGAAMLVIMLPWLTKNLLETKSFGVQALMFGGSAPSLVDWQKIDVSPASCTNTAAQEELGRYIAADTSTTIDWGRYFILPWDMTMNVNQSGFYVDISFLFLAFIPLLLITAAEWTGVIVIMIVFLIPLILYVLLYFAAPELALKLAALKAYVPILLFAGLIPKILQTKSSQLRKDIFWQNVLFLFLGCWYFWLFVASGVPWYGVAGFLFALLLVVRFLQLSKNIHRSIGVIATVMLIVALLSTAILRESRFGTFTMANYTFGLKNADQVLAATNAEYPKIIDLLNADNAHHIYRIGTFINYFIDNNRERVFDDAQLDTFKCIDGDGTDNVRTVQRLKALGFRYIVYDTNTQTIERDTNGTLHKKVNRFTQFAFASLKVVAPTDSAKYKNGIILFELP